MLTIPVVEVGEDGIEVDEKVRVSAIQPEGAVGVPVDEVRLSGVLEDLGGDFLFRGELSGAFESTCDRCLQPATIPFEVEVMWNFEQDPAASFAAAGIEFDEELDLSDSALCRAIEGDEIRLGPALWEELALAVPAKFLCREECQGLCARCGADLNAGACGCPPEEVEAPEADSGNLGLAGLAGLFPDLAPKKDEKKAGE